MQPIEEAIIETLVLLRRLNPADQIVKIDSALWPRLAQQGFKPDEFRSALQRMANDGLLNIVQDGGAVGLTRKGFDRWFRHPPR